MAFPREGAQKPCGKEAQGVQCPGLCLAAIHTERLQSCLGTEKPVNHGARAGLGRKEKPSVKQLEELRSQWAVQAAEEEEAEET